MPWGREEDSSWSVALLRIVGALHPIPPELTARLQRRGELGASVVRGATVLLAPDGGSGAPFTGACVVDTESPTGNLEVMRHQPSIPHKGSLYQRIA